MIDSHNIGNEKVARAERLRSGYPLVLAGKSAGCAPTLKASVVAIGIPFDRSESPYRQLQPGPALSLPLEHLSSLECPPERNLIGVFQIAAYGQAAGQARYGDGHAFQLLANVYAGGLTFN